MLTTIQQELWELIARSNKNEVILSTTEISDALGWKSQQTASNHIAKLESMGYIIRPVCSPKVILAVKPDDNPVSVLTRRLRSCLITIMCSKPIVLYRKWCRGKPAESANACFPNTFSPT